MAKEWYLVIVANTFHEFLSLTLNSTEISQSLQPFPIYSIFATVLCHNPVYGLMLLQQKKMLFLLLTLKTSAFVTLRIKCSLRR